MTPAKKIAGLLDRAASKEAALDAAWQELNITYIAPHKFYGPPSPLPESRPQNGSFGVVHKWGGQKETLTCLGKSWRSSI